MPALELQFRGILYRDDPFFWRDETREDIQEGGFATTGASRNQNIAPFLYREL